MRSSIVFCRLSVTVMFIIPPVVTLVFYPDIFIIPSFNYNFKSDF
nr:MAG TPA: hypothetical protein [Caudoviricetes sp.]